MDAGKTNIDPNSENIKMLFETDQLAYAISQWALSNDNELQQIVIQECSNLHNKHDIDLLTIEIPEVSDFFITVNFLCQILLEIETNPSEMMDYIKGLVTQGGNDMAANRPDNTLREWCKRDPSRANNIINMAKNGDPLAIEHLTFALEAINAIEQARCIAIQYDDIRLTHAIVALSRIEDNDRASQTKTLEVLSNILNPDIDDQLNANLLRCTLAIFVRDPNTHLSNTISLLSKITENSGEFTIHQATRILIDYFNSLSKEIITSLLALLEQTNPRNKGTIRELDYALAKLLNNGYEKEAIDFITNFFSRPNTDLQLNEFDHFIQTIFNGSPQRLSNVVIKWLLLGTPSLCDGLARVVQGETPNDGIILNLEPEDLDISPEHQLFICRKAIGYFLLKPQMAASVLISVLRVCNEETAIKVQELLEHYLLINYPSLGEYLNTLPSNDNAKARVQEVLSKNEDYLRNLHSISILSELRPTEYQLIIQMQIQNDLSHDIYKQVLRRSTLINSVTKLNILYGNRATSSINNSQGKSQAVSIDLNTHRSSFQLPNMEVIDPIELDYIRRTFQQERI